MRLVGIYNNAASRCVGRKQTCDISQVETLSASLCSRVRLVTLASLHLSRFPPKTLNVNNSLATAWFFFKISGPGPQKSRTSVSAHRTDRGLELSNKFAFGLTFHLCLCCFLLLLRHLDLRQNSLRPPFPGHTPYWASWRKNLTQPIRVLPAYRRFGNARVKPVARSGVLYVGVLPSPHFICMHPL